MKKKQVSLLLAAVSLSLVCAAPAIAAEEDLIADIAVESVDLNAAVEDETETADTETAEDKTDSDSESASEEASEAESETETETAEDFVEGSAVLSDYEYEKGKLTEEGWTNEFLNMTYVPGKDISMGIAENEQLATYYERNGEDKQVAVNEMVAIDDEEGYVQLMAEVNPNDEAAEDILERFCDNEGLTLVSDQTDMEIAGKNFLTCTGVVDHDRFLLGVSTDEDNLVIAVKVKYANTVARKALLNGFDVAEETESEEADEAETTNEAESDTEEETEAESETDADGEDAADDGLIMPEEFEDVELFQADNLSETAAE